MTRFGHRPDRNAAAQLATLRCAILLLGGIGGGPHCRLRGYDGGQGDRLTGAVNDQAAGGDHTRAARDADERPQRPPRGLKRRKYGSIRSHGELSSVHGFALSGVFMRAMARTSRAAYRPKPIATAAKKPARPRLSQ